MMELAEQKHVGKKYSERMINALGWNVGDGFMCNTPEKLGQLRAFAKMGKAIENVRIIAKQARADKKTRKKKEGEDQAAREKPLLARFLEGSVAQARTKAGLLTAACLYALQKKEKLLLPRGRITHLSRLL